MIELDFSSDDSITDKDYVVPKQKRMKKVYKKGRLSNDILFEEYYGIVNNVSTYNKKCEKICKLMFLKQITGTEYQQQNKGVIARCKTCNSDIKGTLNVTSNFLRHLKKHEAVYDKYLRDKVESATKETRVKELNKTLVEFFAVSMMPFTLLECKPFRKFLYLLNEHYSLPCRPTVMKLISNDVLEMKEQLKLQIQNANFVCTTADIWSTKTRSFFGYTCHWVDKDLKRKSVALACRRFAGTHNYIKINEILNQIHTEYDLNNSNIIATVTDNGSNFVKTFKEYGIEAYYDSLDFLTEEDNYEFHNDDLEKYLPKHIRCCCHTLSLLATKDYENNIKTCLKYDCHKKVFLYPVFCHSVCYGFYVVLLICILILK